MPFKISGKTVKQTVVRKEAFKIYRIYFVSLYRVTVKPSIEQCYLMPVSSDQSHWSVMPDTTVQSDVL